MLLPMFLKLVVLGLDSRTVSCGEAAERAAGGGGSSLPPACCSRCCIACSKYGTGRTCSNQVGAVQRVHSRMPSCMQEKLCYSRLPCELADSLTRQVHLAAGTQDVYASLTHLL